MATESNTAVGPPTASQRVESIDVLRGVAVLGLQSLMATTIFHGHGFGWFG